MARPFPIEFVEGEPSRSDRSPFPVRVVGDIPGGDAATWSTLSGKPSTFPPEIGSSASTAMAGNTSIPTLPAEATAGELTAGTETEMRLVSPKMIADEIDARIAAAIV